MPRVTIWIREKDYNEWQAIEDKPTFISNAITDYSKSEGLDMLKHIVDRRTNVINFKEPLQRSSDPTTEPFEEDE